jgi:glycerol-3-phosphate dehydrogenase (NAD(P)+)
MTHQVAVIGAGAWGTTLANLLARKGCAVRLWAFEPEVTRLVNEQHENATYLPGVHLQDNLRATCSLEEAIASAGVVVSVAPAQFVRGVMSAAASALDADALVVSASKGIEISTLCTMAGVLAEVLPRNPRQAFISGPSFAREVAAGLPTAVTVASAVPAAAAAVQELFQTPYLRVYTSGDVQGVELGGALKNVIALAAGMSSGLGLGHNALAALITRGLAEMSRLGIKLGANPLTFAGLAGMGDLILTCTGELSRNRTVGYELGQGRKLAEILGGTHTVAEGVDTTRATHDLARREGIEMPIVDEVYAVLFQDRHPREAVENLMLREPKAELWR